MSQQIKHLLFNKYRFNQLVFLAAQTSLFTIFWLLLTKNFQWWQYLSFFILNCGILSCHLNLVHLASHGLLNKNKIVNSILGNISAIFGGLTLADFKTTHAMHHANALNIEKDPDYSIANSISFLTMPFKIWHHDRYFWTKKLWERQNNWIGYIFDRAVQITIISSLSLNGYLYIWVYFWLVPMLVVGVLNGMFLFYLPHYLTNTEKKFRSILGIETNYKLPYIKANNILEWFNLKYKILTLLSINISRIYHEKHHDKTSENENFYPISSYLISKVNGSWDNLTTNYQLKYTLREGPLGKHIFDN